MSKNQSQGLSLLDIGPLYEDVPVTGDKSIRVFGVSARGVFALFARFPNIGTWLQSIGKEGSKIDGASLLTEVPGAISAIIAAGCGSPGDFDAEATADMLPVERQLDILEAIARLTFTNGFGPFVQRIVGLSAAANSLSSGKAQATTSPQASKPVSQSATTPMPSGS